MLINREYNAAATSHVKFVNYTGKYPCLCMGVLTLEIDGDQYTFGTNWKELKLNFDGFWESGGGLIGYEDTYKKEWFIDVDSLPEQFQKYATEIDEVFNSNVPWGCCGGCI